MVKLTCLISYERSSQNELFSAQFSGESQKYSSVNEPIENVTFPFVQLPQKYKSKHKNPLVKLLQMW
ncbi:unnamed protein product [Paramecium octaurelia]|uniref:Uncharacterized protein n=1 Tax=Paramecium octaurelia TaxID=43137 RepID=A0A8S1Y3U8_PAROT|nr:unnamed protein product [Paramecium octaurelia]